MSARPCINHPNELTLVRCGRCDAPICVRCMVDSPVGKKCRSCAQNRTHLSESTPQQVGLAFLAALLVAIGGGWLVRMVPIPILAFPYGYLIAEAALRAGRRSRSLAVQVAVGAAAAAGSFLSTGWVVSAATGRSVYSLAFALEPWSLAITAIATAVAVLRVRFL